mmetsp:Transcript_63668/g.94523  ORF Transcript_63668/g.94523 Transcript_63668/m.94523 type:complete len:106 (+) Transcript_63668:93-410(+)
MLVAMSYMLGCTSRGLSTCPMEGYNAGGIRKVLGIPRRFSIPIIISTGLPYHQHETAAEGDDVGMSHGAPLTSSLGGTCTDRFHMDEVVFGDKFGNIIPQDMRPA